MANFAHLVHEQKIKECINIIACFCHFSSPEHTVVKVSYCDRYLSVVRPSVRIHPWAFRWLWFVDRINVTKWDLFRRHIKTVLCGFIDFIWLKLCHISINHTQNSHLIVHLLESPSVNNFFKRHLPPRQIHCSPISKKNPQKCFLGDPHQNW